MWLYRPVFGIGQAGDCAGSSCSLDARVALHGDRNRGRKAGGGWRVPSCFGAQWPGGGEAMVDTECYPLSSRSEEGRRDCNMRWWQLVFFVC